MTAGSDEVPRLLLDQLAVGGKLVVPIGPPHRQRLRVIRKRKDHFGQEDGEEVVFVPLARAFRSRRSVAGPA